MYMEKPNKPTSPVLPNLPTPLEELSVAQIRKELVSKFQFIGAEFLNTKKQLIAVYNNLQKKALVTLATPAPEPLPVVRDNERKDIKVYESKAARMKALCDEEPKVRFMIPLGIGEKPGAIEEAQINGYKLNMLKGVMINIPQRFATLLEESYNMTALAGKELLADRDETVKEKLGM